MSFANGRDLCLITETSGGEMGRVLWHVTMSLDGLTAGPATR
jgi:hypothetical protein